MKSHMHIVIIAAMTLLLTGCASGCHTACVFGFGPGNPLFESVALNADRNDPCQGGQGATAERRAQLNRPSDYKIPNWCGSSRGNNITVTTKGQTQTFIVRQH
jgi:hypothetical protein